MDKIREKIINFMEHNPETSKLKGDKWYAMEDALVNLFCEMTGTTDKTYETQATTYPTLLDQRLAETDYNEFEYQVYQKVHRHFQYEDLETVLNDDEVDSFSSEEIEFYKNNADNIINKYDDCIEYDWRTAMLDAIDYLDFQSRLKQIQANQRLEENK